MWIFFWKRPENQIPDQGSVWRVRFAAERIYKSGASGGYFRHTAGAWKYSSGDGHGTDRKWICICKFNYGGDSADQYGSDSGNLSCRVHYHRTYTWTRRAGKSTGAGMDLSMARSDCGGSRSRDYFADPFLCNRAL